MAETKKLKKPKNKNYKIYPEQDKVQIDSIVGYLQTLKDFNLKDCISRGEIEDYGDTRLTAHAIRPTLQEKDKHIYDQEDIDTFYNELCNQLTSLQEKHFLAFAQHHGLPTSLLDFTTNPLISLFMACYSDSLYQPQILCPNCKPYAKHSVKEKPGYVYFIKEKQNEFIAIYKELTPDNYILKNNINTLQKLGQDLLDEKIKITPLSDYLFDLPNVKEYVLTNKKNLMIFNKYCQSVKSIIKAIISNPGPNGIDECFQSVLDFNILGKKPSDFINMIINSIENIFYLDVTDSIWEEKCTDSLSLNKILNAKLKNDKEYNEYQKCNIMLGLLLHLLLKCSASYSDKTVVKHIYIPIYFNYTPPNIIGRINAQNSIFLYQAHSYSSIFLIIQDIIPDFTIEITNKQQILQELDTLGINLKTIYGDYDSIAKHIKNKKYA